MLPLADFFATQCNRGLAMSFAAGGFEWAGTAKLSRSGLVTTISISVNSVETMFWTTNNLCAINRLPVTYGNYFSPEKNGYTSI